MANLSFRGTILNHGLMHLDSKIRNPEDLISNVRQFDGHTFKPPIEAVLEKVLETDGYIQTSGSAGQIATMVEIVEEYIKQLEDYITPSGEGTLL